MFTTPGGIASVISAVVSLAGIVFVGMAGKSKEGELSEEQKRLTVAEFNFRKGILIAIFSGLMSSAMSFGLQGGPSLQQAAMTIDPKASIAWAGMPVLVVVLLGGFAVNFIWCLFLNVKNRTAGDYVRTGVPVFSNLIFAAIAGAIWCSQFICFKTGEPEMGDISYIGWAVLMASQILFSQLLGMYLGEWKGTGRSTRRLLAIGLILLIVSAMIAGIAGSL
jgi:L-rhamnose-H+ transport protein